MFRYLYKKVAKERSEELVFGFRTIHVTRDYEKLLKSSHYKTEYKFVFNESKIPLLMESKYILVPTYDYLQITNETPILQEHIIGTGEYVLSKGSPTKKTKLSYSMA